MRSWILAVKLDEQERIASMKRFLPATGFKRPMDMELGSDGALYIMEWGTQYNGGNSDAQIVRIDYHENPGAQTRAAPVRATRDVRSAVRPRAQASRVPVLGAAGDDGE